MVAKHLEPEQVRAILERGNFDELVGTVEDERLECKAAIYQVQDDHEKQEFAKDISALANAQGGLILIGVKTERDPTHFGDEIIEIRPFAQTRFNPNQWQAVLQSWIYPSLQHIEIRWWPSANDGTRGIVVIHIPQQPSAQRPFLVTRTIDDKGKRVEVVFGYVERRQANAVPYSVQELHTFLRDGLRYDVFNQQFEHIHQALQTLQTERHREAQQVSRQTISGLLTARIKQALIDVALHDKPAFILAAVPTHPVEIPTLFASQDADVVRSLEYPPKLRPYGFGLSTGAPARIVRGQLRRAITDEAKLLELWPDGTLVAISRGDENFLAWGKYSGSSGPLRINPLVMIESTYAFAVLSKHVFDGAQPRPLAIEYRLELRNMTRNNTPCGLIPGPLGTFAMEFGTDIYRASDADAAFTVDWEDTEINPQAVAFLLISQVYQWFGLEHDLIPYTEQIDNHLVISRDKIQEVG